MGITPNCVNNVMNTIPTTFNTPDVPYMVVGGSKSDKKKQLPSDLSILVLNRGSRLYKDEFFTELEKMGDYEILSVESPGTPYDVETLTARHPKVRFLVFQEAVSAGKQINTGIEESHGRYILVLWNDAVFQSSGSLEKLISRTAKQNVLCVVPVLQDQKYEMLPSLQAPAFHRNKLKMVSLAPKADEMTSLYPFDYTGIYNKEKFILVGGYDITMNQQYWQKLDFGFRSYMWGEKIICDTSFRFVYRNEIPPEDTTPESSYKLFFLKNLCIRFQGDTGVLPASRFFSYLFKSGGTFLQSLEEFKIVRAWVKINKYRFQQDARSVTELWEIPEM